MEEPDAAWHPVGATTDIDHIPKACKVRDTAVRVWRTTTGEIVALAERPQEGSRRVEWPKTFLAREFGASVYLWVGPRHLEPV
jgi:hypothetical protein